MRSCVVRRVGAQARSGLLCALLSASASYDLRYRLPARITGFEFMPVVYPVLALFPAPEYFLPVELAVKVDQSRIESLEHAADLLELEQEIVDVARDVVDAAAQRELLGRLAPFGSGLRGDELVLRHQIAPLGMESDQVGHDPLHQRESPIGFCKSKVFARHRTNLDAQTRRRSRRTGENSGE